MEKKKTSSTDGFRDDFSTVSFHKTTSLIMLAVRTTDFHRRRLRLSSIASSLWRMPSCGPGCTCTSANFSGSLFITSKTASSSMAYDFYLR